MFDNHFYLMEVRIKRWQSSWENDKNYSHHRRSEGEGEARSVSSKEWVRDGVKLEKVVLKTNWLLLSGPGGLSEEDVQVPVCHPQDECALALPPASPSHFPPGQGWDLRTPGTREIPAKPQWIKRWDCYGKSLSPTLATHPPACLLRYLNPAHPSPLITGALLDLLKMLPSVVLELGWSSKSSSIFSSGMSVSREKPLFRSEFSTFSGSHSHKDTSAWSGDDVGREKKGGKRREEEALRRVGCSLLQPYHP